MASAMSFNPGGYSPQGCVLAIFSRRNPMKIDVRDIKYRAAGRWDNILGALAPQLAPALDHPGKHCDCPIHGGRSDFRVFKDVAETGGGICTCGTWPDGFALLEAANGWNFSQTLKEVADFILGVSFLASKPPTVRRTEGLEKQDARIRSGLNRFWKSAQHGSEEMQKVLWQYFLRRGLRTPPLSLLDIRYHPSASYQDKDGCSGKYPAMLARVHDPKGNPVSIHRTYLTLDGHKAAVQFPKKLMAHVSTADMKGSAIRLAPAGKVLAVAEGIETSIAVMEMTGLPCWCVINAGLMAHFVPPEGVEHLHIFADKDSSSAQHPKGHGQEAAEFLASRVSEMDISVSVELPPIPVPTGQKGVDWLDVVARIRHT
jgi:phage/plasmid primase-like uncharacterized protein